MYVCTPVRIYVFELEKIPTKVVLNGLKRNVSRGNSLSDELTLVQRLVIEELICIVS